MNEYPSGIGTRNDITAVDSESILSELSVGQFSTSTKAGSYSAEIKTKNYIDSLFKALEQIETEWKKCVSCARSYIEDFENVPLPPLYPDDSNDLDIEEFEVPLSGTLTGVTSTLNIRASANGNSSIIGNISANSKIEKVLGKITDKDGNEWYKIQTANGTGYVLAKYVKINGNTAVIPAASNQSQVQRNSGFINRESSSGGQSSSATVTSQNNIKVAMVNLENPNIRLNLRSSPEIGDNIIGELVNGSIIKVIEDDGINKFVKIQLSDNSIAYVLREYISYLTDKTNVTI